jgi:hypothetical protein
MGLSATRTSDELVPALSIPSLPCALLAPPPLLGFRISPLLPTPPPAPQQLLERMGTFQRKSHRRAAAAAAACEATSHLAQPQAEPPAPLPAAAAELLNSGGALDPEAGGELADAPRAQRKREQTLSLAAHALSVGVRCHARTVAELGAGSGQLGLLLAVARPDWHVALVEVKPYACDVARRRVAELRLSNCEVFEMTVDSFYALNRPCDLFVGLHLCGALSHPQHAPVFSLGFAITGHPEHYPPLLEQGC